MNKTSKRKIRNGLDHEVNRVIVKPLIYEIRSQGANCLKQSKRILKKLNQVDQSIEIIAREIAHQIKNNDQ